ncbi:MULTISPECIES: FtsW/RodA/SpoVE family cell cycle protein [Pseudothermotoga]|uniref:Probable peptidoglycan glycosyltransferase FtsW n=1 Tax=Pseudothermotoga lettingae (strain ATCC BAA-301 / DSM 14385 / NBRC 107922 / TMO) TaxID=416591 RepID=A8F4X0_PSELT|nr:MULTISPECIES: FtsW/RodA/SpoVE family cell cycle protein [Pseudothermotoga]ABV33204.1 cell cycle protein [Pseudothermotoga lettingae TMO]KUK21998.1 MAG: Cell cycle protein [Pseudothermotoga lettingae]GLI49879.1 cell division protein FtsW [Pseudothermotoga lettingae TMO]HBJ81641.1 cell cycle protein [Pseudothermotoga sp.]HBT25186.1 cell cycle protein [Pseudothermotoga sp.]
MNEAISVLLVVAILISVGIVAIASIDIAAQMNVFGNFSRDLLYSHVGKLCVGVVLMIIASMFDYRNHIKFSWFYYFFALGLLSLPFFFPGANGSRRWVSISGANFQPSEFAKIIFIIIIATYISQNKERMGEFVSGFLKPLLYSFPFFALIVLEPDLSTTMIFIFLALLMLYSHGTKGRYIFLTLLGLFSVFYIAGKTGIILKDYQIWRLRTFINGQVPEQVSKALQAIREGGLTGKGLGIGEVKVSVPAVVSDFILAAVGEELGLIGILGIIILFFILIALLLKHAEKLQDTFATAYISGFSFLIMLQVMVNLGVVTGTLPVTGVTMPFMSYGGSSIVTMMAGLGIVINILTRGSEEP